MPSGATHSRIGAATPAGASPAAQKQAIAQAAKQYGIPDWTLWGVYGIETAFGGNIATSSAGAVGAFQFLPSTAAGFSADNGGRGYPLTNTPTAQQFSDQANVAAHYLSNLFKQTGSWEAAFQHYSGGGYGAAQVQAKAKGGAAQKIGPDVPGAVAGAAGDAAGAVAGAVTGTAKLIGVLLDPATWIRIGSAIAGMVLIYLGLKSLTGADPVGAAVKMAV